jgi:hypothetical protein
MLPAPMVRQSILPASADGAFFEADAKLYNTIYKSSGIIALSRKLAEKRHL